MSTSYCPGCMSPKPAIQTCLFCGFQESAYHPPKTSLPIGVQVDCYQSGALIASNRQAQCYIARDLATDHVVLLEEFFPFTVVGRVPGKPTVASIGADSKFSLVAGLFETSQQKRPLPFLRSFRANNTVYRVYELTQNQDYREQAEKLMEQPIVFQDESGHPLMSINALVIPPMPKERSFRGKKKKRGKTSLWPLMVVGVVLAAFVGLFATGILTFGKQDKPVAAYESNANYITNRKTTAYKTVADAQAGRNGWDVDGETLVSIENVDNDEADNLVWWPFKLPGTENGGYIRAEDVSMMTADGLEAYRRAFIPDPVAVEDESYQSEKYGVRAEVATFYFDIDGRDIADLHALYLESIKKGNKSTDGSSSVHTVVDTTMIALSQDFELTGLKRYEYVDYEGLVLSAWYYCEYSQTKGYIHEDDVYLISEEQRDKLIKLIPTVTPLPTQEPVYDEVDMDLVTLNEVCLMDENGDQKYSVWSAYTQFHATRCKRFNDGTIWYYCEYTGDDGTYEGYLRDRDVVEKDKAIDAVNVVSTPSPSPTLVPTASPTPEPIIEVIDNPTDYMACRDTALRYLDDPDTVLADIPQFSFVKVKQLICLWNGVYWAECEYENNGITLTGFVPLSDLEVQSADDVRNKLASVHATPEPVYVNDQYFVPGIYKVLRENEVFTEDNTPLSEGMKVNVISCERAEYAPIKLYFEIVTDNGVAKGWAYEAELKRVSEFDKDISIQANQINPVVWFKDPDRRIDELTEEESRILNNLKVALTLLGKAQTSRGDISEAGWERINSRIVESYGSQPGLHDRLRYFDYSALLKEAYKHWLMYRYVAGELSLTEYEDLKEASLEEIELSFTDVDLESADELYNQQRKRLAIFRSNAKIIQQYQTGDDETAPKTGSPKELCSTVGELCEYINGQVDVHQIYLKQRNTYEQDKKTFEENKPTLLSEFVDNINRLLAAQAENEYTLIQVDDVTDITKMAELLAQAGIVLEESEEVSPPESTEVNEQISDSESTDSRLDEIASDEISETENPRTVTENGILSVGMVEYWAGLLDVYLNEDALYSEGFGSSVIERLNTMQAERNAWNELQPERDAEYADRMLFIRYVEASEDAVDLMTEEVEALPEELSATEENEIEDDHEAVGNGTEGDSGLETSTSEESRTAEPEEVYLPKDIWHCIGICFKETVEHENRVGTEVITITIPEGSCGQLSRVEKKYAYFNVEGLDDEICFPDSYRLSELCKKGKIALRVMYTAEEYAMGALLETGEVYEIKPSTVVDLLHMLGEEELDPSLEITIEYADKTEDVSWQAFYSPER